MEKERKDREVERREKESLLHEKLKLLKLVETLQHRIPDSVFYDAYFGRTEEVKNYMNNNREMNINSICQSDDIQISGKSLAFIVCQKNHLELLSFLMEKYRELDLLLECVLKDIDLLKYGICRYHLAEITGIYNKLHWLSLTWC